jgi:hypothetical protein
MGLNVGSGVGVGAAVGLGAGTLGDGLGRSTHVEPFQV